MLRFCPLLVALLWLAPPAEAQQAASRAGDVSAAEAYTEALSAVLAHVVTEDGLVRYDLLQGELREPFRQVLKAIETYDPARLQTTEERLAFWLNAYNVQMLQTILDAPEVTHIIDDGAADRFFKTPRLTAGFVLTLDQIEHHLLRGEAPPDAPYAPYALAEVDPRIHVGLNCAAVSCPPLPQAAFRPGSVDRQLDDAFRAFVNDPAHLRMEGGRLVASSLLDWFAADFDRPGRPAGDLLLGLMSPEREAYAALRTRLHGRTAAELKTSGSVIYVYDWTVNRAPAR